MNSPAQTSCQPYPRITNLDSDSNNLERLPKQHNEETSLNRLEARVDRLEKSLARQVELNCERELVVQSLRRRTALYDRFLNPFRLVDRLMPRLFVLNQHAPERWIIPPSYAAKTSFESPPRISIVTPSYNQAEFLPRTLKSVLGQNYPHLEYVVQDGGSTDDSAGIIRKHGDQLLHWESKPDHGQANAINLGFERTTGEIMAYLNSDDVLLPGTLDYVARMFQRRPDIDVIYGHRYIINADDQLIGKWILPRHNSELLSWADFVPQETLFWRRKIWDQAGGHIDESFKFALDWDLLLRFREANAKMYRAPRFLGAFRVTEHHKTTGLLETVGKKEMNRLRKRTLNYVPSDREVARRVRRYQIAHTMHRFWHRLGIPS